MGYVSAIKPFSTLFAEKKCTTKGSDQAQTKTQMQLHIKSSPDKKFPGNGFGDYLLIYFTLHPTRKLVTYKDSDMNK